MLITLFPISYFSILSLLRGHLRQRPMPNHQQPFQWVSELLQLPRISYWTCFLISDLLHSEMGRVSHPVSARRKEARPKVVVRQGKWYVLDCFLQIDMIKSAYFQLWSLLPFPQHGGDVDHQPQLHLHPKPRYVDSPYHKQYNTEAGQEWTCFAIQDFPPPSHPTLTVQRPPRQWLTPSTRTHQVSQQSDVDLSIPGINCETFSDNNLHLKSLTGLALNTF